MRKRDISIVLFFLAGFGVAPGLAERLAVAELLAREQIFLSAFAGEQDSPPSERFTFEEPHMGTKFRIVLYAADKDTAEKAAKSAFARVEELNRIMSDYLAESELMLLCKKAGGEPVAVSEDLFKVLKKADDIAKLTDGALDVSIGPVVRLWRKARRTGKLPDAEELKKALALVDFRKIQLDPNGRRVRLILMGMLLDLGAIAKGYAADAAVQALRRQGIRSALVAAGGDIAVSEPPPGVNGWKIAIAGLKGPDDADNKHIWLKNAAVSTAGDLYQNVEIDGKRYSHIIDPKTGQGLLGRRSVTVIAPDGATADGLDTAICIIGIERGLKLLDAMDGVAGIMYFETSQGVQMRMSKRFAEFEAKP